MSDAVDLVRVNESQHFCSNFWKGSTKRFVYNCRHLPFENANRDVVIVQAGLHHLPRLPEDLEMTLAEMRRVLRPVLRFLSAGKPVATEVKRQTAVDPITPCQQCNLGNASKRAPEKAAGENAARFRRHCVALLTTTLLRSSV
jgi:SAM-dependent methyltransferase